MPAEAVRAVLLLKDVAVVLAIGALLPRARVNLRLSLPDLLAAGYAAVVAAYAIVPRLAGDDLPIQAVVASLRELLFPVELYALGRVAAAAGADAGRLAWTAVWAGVAAAVFALAALALAPPTFWTSTLDLVRFIREVQGVPFAQSLQSVSIVAAYGQEALFARAVGPFTHPVGAGHYFVLPLAMALSLAGASTTSLRDRRLLVAAAVVLGVAIIGTISRGAWAAAAVAVLVVAWRVKQLKLGLASLLIVGTVLAAAPPYSYSLWSFFSGSDSSTIGHRDAIEEGIDTLSKNPLGVGVGHSDFFAEAYAAGAVNAGETLYLTIAVAAGPAALLLFVGWLLTVLYRLRRSVPRIRGVGDDAGGWLRFAVAATVIGVALSAIVSSPLLRFTTAATFWMMLGLAVSYWQPLDADTEDTSATPAS